MLHSLSLMRSNQYHVFTAVISHPFTTAILPLPYYSQHEKLSFISLSWLYEREEWEAREIF